MSASEFSLMHRGRAAQAFSAARMGPRTALLRWLASALVGASLLALPASAQAQVGDDTLLLAKEAFTKRDKPRLANLKAQLTSARHPLAVWADYWDLSLRLNEARSEDVEAFYARWPGSYQEDRLRNDWLLELGRRRDFAAFQRELPRFRMNDDKEVACYALWAEHLQGKDVREAARRAWMAQRDADDGCQGMAQALWKAGQFKDEDIWRKVRQATELGRVKLARESAEILDADRQVAEVLDKPLRYMKLKASALGHQRTELAALALARLAATEPAQAADMLASRWANILGAEHGAWAWAVTARHGALALHADALTWQDAAWASWQRQRRPAGTTSATPDWSDDTLAWHVRAALRLGEGAGRWEGVLRAISAMSPTEQADPAWQYWRSRAMWALAKPGESGEAQRAAAREAMSKIAGPWTFYSQLAAEDLGYLPPLPPRPAALSNEELEAARRHEGLQRALAGIGAGLRPEGVREWNFHLIGRNDRELLAAATLACEREVWDRCITAAERTRQEIDAGLRYPVPLLSEVTQHARQVSLDPAYVYGLVRQESRFIVDARSSVGASGLMQVMPATARWTAKKVGMTDFKPAMITERETNLRIGTAYLKLVLDSLDGVPALAAAAYNAGPSRARRWRDGPALEPAIWIENIPFNETRDYVKKVLSNTTVYSALTTGRPASLKARLGSSIGPRDPSAPAPNSDPDLP